MAILMNCPPPEDGIHHQEPNTTAYYESKEIGKGTLYITENVFCWVSTTGEGFSLEYQSIYIHAVSKDLTNFPHECLFLMVDGEIVLGEGCNGAEDSELVKHLNSLRMNEEENEDDGEEKPPTELRFVPENKNMLDVMFQALSDCQTLNPDPADASEDDEDAHPTFNIQYGSVEYGAVEEENGEEEEYEDADMNEDQFEDAEE